MTEVTAAPEPRRRRWKQPDVIRLGSRRWQLRQAYTFEDEKLGRKIHIPAGFIFDLSSIPRALWAVIAPEDLGELAALLHDWLYRNMGVIGDDQEPYTRGEADDLFRRVMLEDNVRPAKRRAAYTAVRVFGRGAWGDAPVVIEPVDETGLFI